MSTFISLYTAFSGLQAAQAGMDTASHNVANAATPGYTRQRVDLVSRRPHVTPFGQVGQGVDVADIIRARDAMHDTRVRSGSADLGRLDVMADLLGGVEEMLGEPDNGITATLAELWNAFEDLAMNPPDTAARIAVLSRLESVAGSVRRTAVAWDTAAETAGAGLAGTVDQVNSILHAVVSLNQAILEAGANPGTPNDLMDQRDVMLDRLAELAGATVSITDKGAARVSLNGLALVSGVTVSELSHDPVNHDVLHASGASAQLGGALAGYQSFLTAALPGYQTKLDTFAEEMTAAINAQHAAGFNAAGAPGPPLLSYTPGSAAFTISVSLSDPTELASAATPGPPFPDFDGTNADLLAGLRSSLTAGGGTVTIEAAMRGIVGDIGSTTAATFDSASRQAARQAAAETSRLEAHGVSLDEEMVLLINFQRSYEAASRVMTSVDQALDTLINRTGIVGR